MSYCSNCGGRLNDKGLCPNCGGMSEANVRPSQKDDSEVLVCLRKFFSQSPLGGVERAARTKAASVWVTYSSLYVVVATALSLVSLIVMPEELIKAVFGGRIAAAAVAANSAASGTAARSFGLLTAYSALMAVAFIALLSAVTRIVFLLAEEKPSFNQALNIPAFSTFTLSVGLLLAVPLSFLSFSAAMSAVMLGAVSAAVCYYFGIQKASAFRKSPFLLLLLLAVCMAALLRGISFLLTLGLFG